MTPILRSSALVAPCLLLALASNPIRAVEPSPAAAGSLGDSSSAFVIDAFDPGLVPTFDLLSLARTRTPGHLLPAFSVHLGYVDALLELSHDGDARDVRSVLVSHRVRADIVLAVGVLDRLAMSLHLPFLLDQGGGDLALLNRPGESAGGAAFGDLRLGARGTLFRVAGFGVALGAELHVPVGDRTAFMSYGEVRLRPFLALDWHADTGLGVVVNVGYALVPETAAHNLVLDDALTWGFGLDLPTPEPTLHVLASVVGTTALTDGRDPSDPRAPRTDDRNQPVELVAAFELSLGDLVLSLGGGAGLSRGVGAPSWRTFAEVAWSPARRQSQDRDGDGILDARDACPDAAEDRDGFQDADGCPDPDNDGDGIPDVDDGSPDATGFGSCRDIPEDMDGYFDQDGCPEPDNDADGIRDRDDGPLDASGFGACRDQPEDFDGHEDHDGCPDPDNDGDGVPDVVDGPPDKDGFGVCRDSPETKNGYRDEDGCPDEAPKSVRVTQFKIEIMERVFFQYDKALIKPESFALLDEVARVLIEAPELTLVQVEGHTDGEGAVEYNDRLSQRRAEAVRDYLVTRGVEASRLGAKGFGKSRPLVTGPAAMRPQGKALNRRVEFVILEVNGQPHSPDKPVILDRPVVPEP